MKSAKSIPLIVILTVSLCFNVFFASSYAIVGRAAKNLRTAQGRAQLIARHLKLTKQQKEELAQLIGQVQQYRKEMRKNHASEVDELCNELSKAQPDYNRVNQLIGIVVGERAKLAKFRAEKIQEFLKTLNLQQRQVVVKKIGKIRALININ